jgi:hypothetical protein
MIQGDMLGNKRFRYVVVSLEVYRILGEKKQVVKVIF